MEISRQTVASHRVGVVVVYAKNQAGATPWCHRVQQTQLLVLLLLAPSLPLEVQHSLVDGRKSLKTDKNWAFSTTEGDCNAFVVNSIQENLCKAFFEQADNGPPPSDDFDSSPKSNRSTGSGSGDIVTRVDG